MTVIEHKKKANVQSHKFKISKEKTSYPELISNFVSLNNMDDGTTI